MLAFLVFKQQNRSEVVGLGVLFAQTWYADIRGLVTAGFRLHR